MENKLHDIVEVITLEQDDDINKRLQQGWIILETYTTCYDTEGSCIKHQYSHCRLGRPSEVKPFVDVDERQYGIVL